MRIRLNKLTVAAVIVILVVATAIFAVIGVRGLYTFLVGLGYAGAFLSGLVGTSSLMISVFPPQVVVFVLSDPSMGFNPLLLGSLAGVGAGIGQFAHYYIGEGGRYALPEKYRAMIDRWRPKVEKYGFILIFLFAATPLTPDDVIWIPLGAMKYPKKKALIASITGKTVMLVAFAYAGHYGISTIRRWLHF
jgi:membrane protein YqaA with SNARE-associated domain